MNKPNLSALFNTTKAVLTKNSPKILTGIGIAGMATTTVLAVKATPKALREIEEYEEAVLCDHQKIKPLDAVKICWKYYVPAAVTGVVSIGCLIGANHESTRRTAALATAYKLSETALAEYREKVVETIGEKKEQLIREKVDEERIKKNPVSRNEVIVTKKGGSTLCYDYPAGRYFESDIELVKKALNRLNASLLREDYVSLNDFYDEIGLDHVGVGDDLGWNIAKTGRDLIELSVSYQGSDDGTPCAVIAFDPMPYPKFSMYQ